MLAADAAGHAGAHYIVVAVITRTVTDGFAVAVACCRRCTYCCIVDMILTKQFTDTSSSL